MKKSLTFTLVFLLLAWLMLTPAIAQEGPDEVESNDTMELADYIDGFAFTGLIGAKGDSHDWFALDGQEGFNPGFYLYYNDAQCDIDMEIWSGDEIVGSLTATHSPDYGEFYVPDTCWIHVWAHSGVGEYTIEIVTDAGSGGGGGGGGGGDYNSGCEGADEIESNDTRDLADSISYDEINGYACVGDVDWFVLQGQEGSNPEISISYNEYDVDVDVEIYSGYDLVGSLTSSSGYDSGTFRVPSTCYLKVYQYDGEGYYTIDIYAGGGGGGGGYIPPGGGGYKNDCEGDDEVESNDTRDLADSISFDEIEGYACSGDVDWFVLQGQEGTNPEISITYNEYEVDVDVEIYSGYDLVGSLTSSSGYDSDSFHVPDTCYLKVYQYDGEGYYTIDIYAGGGGHSGGGGGGYHTGCEGPDEVESNDTKSLADSISHHSIEGYACAGDDDWFVLTGQEGTYPTITLYYDDAHCDIDLEIYSGDDYIGSLTSVSSPDWDDFNIPSTCYIHVYTHTGEGAYTIEIEP